MQLIEQVQNYLDITWNMSRPEIEKLQGMIDRGIAALTGKIGSCNFEEETQEKALLLSYVMYERSGALDEFWRNYQSEIVALQMDRWVKNAENKKQEVRNVL